jgi:hypothetical protein
MPRFEVVVTFYWEADTDFDAWLQVNDALELGIVPTEWVIANEATEAMPTEF